MNLFPFVDGQQKHNSEIQKCNDFFQPRGDLRRSRKMAVTMGQSGSFALPEKGNTDFYFMLTQ
jgi:hypothetical protein